MRKDIFDQIRSGVFPFRSFENRGSPMVRHSNPELKQVHSGTTVLAFYYDKGLLFAGDKKTSNGFSIVEQDKTKIYQISPYSCCAAAGLVSDIQMLVRDIEEVNYAFLGKYDQLLSIEGQVNYLVNELRFFWQYSPMPMSICLICGGMNPVDGKFGLFEIGTDGFRRECFDYVATGSGMDFATSKLEENRKKLLERRLSREEAIEVAVRAIFTAGKKDLGTSDIRIALPDVATVTEEGFSFVDKAIIRNAADNLIKEDN